jgi:hypothetical protein
MVVLKEEIHMEDVMIELQPYFTAEESEKVLTFMESLEYDDKEQNNG